LSLLFDAHQQQDLQHQCFCFVQLFVTHCNMSKAEQFRAQHFGKIQCGISFRQAGAATGYAAAIAAA
jgi:hypothetical protein